VLKDGETVDELRVGRQACFVLGRNEDVCDFGMQHPSISRQHAAVVHDKEGRVNILDLGSAQGTFVNGKEIEPNEPHALNGTP
jgi:pSer/pThr/pTyr-binding forkhead associated (FHA) protein